MGMERIGLGGVLTFDASQAIRSMGQARDEMGRFMTAAQRLGPSMSGVGGVMTRLGSDVRRFAGSMASGIGQLTSGLRNAGLAAIPLAMGLAHGVQDAVHFEQAMSRVNAITLGSADEMRALTAEARRLGIVTTFSSSEAAAGMEEMARAGATTQQIITGVGGVMAAAAAEGIDLSRATEIVGITANTTGQSWDQSSHIADVLALASARTNSSIESLGEAFTYGGLQAHTAGMSFEQTTAILALLHNAGLRGSSAGTALQNALIKLAQPSRAAADRMHQWGIVMTQTADGGVDFANIVTQLQQHISTLPTAMERTAAANEIFGVRGARAFFALAQAGETAVDDLQTALGASSRFEGKQGAAAAMANRQLDNMAGAWKLLTSSIEATNISIFTPMLRPLATLIKDGTAFLNLVLEGINAITDAGDDMDRKWTVLRGLQKEGPVVLNIVMGITDAIQDMKDGVAYLQHLIQQVGEAFGQSLGGDTIRQITRFALLFVVVAGALAPVLLGLGGIALIITSVIIPIVSGLGEIIGAVVGLLSGPFLGVLAAVAVAFMLIRNDGESFGQTMTRIWETIQAAVMEVWDSAIMPLWEGIQSTLVPAFSELQDAWMQIFDVLKQAFRDIGKAFGDTGADITINWRAVGEGIGNTIRVAAYIITGLVFVLAELFKWLAPVVGGAIAFIVGVVGNVVTVFKDVWTIIMQVIDGFKLLFSGEIISGLESLGMALFNTVVEPLRFILRNMLAVLDAIGQGDKVPAVVRNALTAGNSLLNNDAEAAMGRAAAGNQPSFLDRVAHRQADMRARAAAGTTTQTDQEIDALGRAVGERRAATTRRAGETPRVAVDVAVGDNRNITVDNRICMDGAEVARATERHREEISERSGFRATPWERRVRVEHGARRLGGG